MESAEKQAQLSLLLVDDDKELCAMMKEFFAEAGHRLDCEYDGRRGFACAASGTYDLVILDVMLPAIDGFSRAATFASPERPPRDHFDRARSTPGQDSRVECGGGRLSLKPFDPDELLARIRAVLRRTETASWKSRNEVTIGDIRINAVTRELWIAGSPAELTQMEFDLLQLLMRSAGRVVSRDEITLALFERQAAPYDRILDVHISHLRRKLKAGRNLIRTIRGVGYVFAGAA